MINRWKVRTQLSNSPNYSIQLIKEYNGFINPKAEVFPLLLQKPLHLRRKTSRKTIPRNPQTATRKRIVNTSDWKGNPMLRYMRSLEICLGRQNGDELMWKMELKPHAAGDFSMAVVQANSHLEDQSQVFTSPSATYIGVYDGHGGSEASRFVNRYLFPYIRKFATELGGLSPDAIRKAFNKTEEDFTRLVQRSMSMKPQITLVGSCCLVGVISNGELYVANLGDSRAVLGKRGSIQGKNSVMAERLTIDHNVSYETVRKEVEELHPDDSPVVVNCRGVWRIKGIIQVSRSIGDVYLKKPEFYRDPNFLQYGNYIPMKRPLLTAEPSIVTRNLKPQDLFVIFASDGLWEHLSDETAVEIVSKNPRSGIAKRLVVAALQAASKKKEMRYKDITKIEKGTRRHFHDDITVIVVYLDHQNPSNINKRQGSFGCVMSPIDIYSNSDEVVENSGDKVFPNEEFLSRLAY